MPDSPLLGDRNLTRVGERIGASVTATAAAFGYSRPS